MIPPAYSRLEAGDLLVGSQCYLCRERFIVGDIPIAVPAGTQQHNSVNFSVSAPAHWRCTEHGKAVMAGTELAPSKQLVIRFTGQPAALAEQIEEQMKAGWEVTAMTTIYTAVTIDNVAQILVTFRRAP